MAARKIHDTSSMRPEAVHLREALSTASSFDAADPLKLRREALDQKLRDMRAQTKTLVEAIK